MALSPLRCTNRLEILVNNFFIVALLLPAMALVKGTLPNPAVPTAEVPRVAYRSVFADTPTGIEQEAADWKKANAEVGQFRRGHADILKWEAEQARLKGAGPATPAAPGGHHEHGGKP